MADMTTEERPRSKQVGALRGLAPFIRPYRLYALIAGAALVLTATVSLILPMAVRRVVDGFGAQDAELLDQYFGAALAIAALLAVGTGLRYYFVTRLGERVVADIRKAVFNNVLGLSPEFFEVTRTGEVLSRLTADTTLIQQVVGSSASVAMRNMVTVTGGLALMFVTSFKLALLVIVAVLAVLVPMLFFGRWPCFSTKKTRSIRIRR